jgi:hypothetical protein
MMLEPLPIGCFCFILIFNLSYLPLTPGALTLVLSQGASLPLLPLQK